MKLKIKQRFEYVEICSNDWNIFNWAVFHYLPINPKDITKNKHFGSWASKKFREEVIAYNNKLYQESCIRDSNDH